jgi:hypothetical protein
VRRHKIRAIAALHPVHNHKETKEDKSRNEGKDRRSVRNHRHRSRKANAKLSAS